jgi:hypothetical protein
MGEKLMRTKSDESSTAVVESPTPRIVSEYSRVKRPEPLQGDFPIESELGWKRFSVRGVDNLIINQMRQPRCGAFPNFYVVAPDADSAWAVYVDAIREELEMHSRKPEHLQRVVVALED